MKFPGRYILDADGEPVLCDDLIAWVEWFERTRLDRSRVIAQDVDERDPAKTVMVSTVFLGLDHQFGDGPPVLWETLVMGGVLDGQMNRYTSRAAALRGHQAMCERVTAAGGSKPAPPPPTRSSRRRHHHTPPPQLPPL
jgi:hypothetical protein